MIDFLSEMGMLDYKPSNIPVAPNEKCSKWTKYEPVATFMANNLTFDVQLLIYDKRSPKRVWPYYMIKGLLKEFDLIINNLIVMHCNN